MQDNLKLTPSAANNEIIEKIKIDASQPVSFFGTPQGSSKKVSKRSSRQKVVTKFRQVKTPK